jgi:DGQHR domain-containing protein
LEKDKIVMYSFSPRVEDIMEYITVLRMARKYDKKGFQRMVKLTRLNKMSEYLEKNETFPNNIIIALDPETYKKEENFYTTEDGEEIALFDEYNSLIIIDGQHRFFSFVKGDKLDRQILITLIFFKEGDKDDLVMEKLFYKINKTQERIDPNLSFILEAKIEPNSEANFWYNVFKNRLDRKGFFAGRFSFKETTMKKGESKKSIISVITYGGVLGLNKKYKRRGMEVNGLDVFYTIDKENNINFASNLLKNYFDIIELVMHSQGVDKNNLTPREIGALIRLIKHFMVINKNKLKFLGENKDITKSKVKEDIKTTKYFKNIIKNIPFRQTIHLDYPASNWAAVEGYMLRKINNRKPTFGNKNLLSKKGYEIYTTGV